MTNPKVHGERSNGLYFKIKNEKLQDFISEVASQFHIRDGGEEEDGSRGHVKITHRQLLDSLAYLYQEGFEDGFDYVLDKMSAQNN